MGSILSVSWATAAYIQTSKQASKQAELPITVLDRLEPDQEKIVGKNTYISPPNIFFSASLIEITIHYNTQQYNI